MRNKLPAQILQSSSKDEVVAISEIKNKLKIISPEAIIFFCSSYYNLDALSQAFNDTFDCQIIGCTTAGEISDRYYSHSIVALVLAPEKFALHSVLIDNLESFDLPDAMKASSIVERQLKFSVDYASDKMFGFLLTDGLSLKEEKLVARLNQAFDHIDIFGGSAGDDLNFNTTHIFHESVFHTNAAVMSIIEVKDDFSIFKTQHFCPTEKEFITTKVDFDNRVVIEINGEPAADAYASINGLDSNVLDSIDFAIHPLMINMADEWYIRSIAHVNEDKSLQFYCAIDEGLPLTIAVGENMETKLNESIDSVLEQFEEVYFTLGCDCILRRLEISDNNLFGKMEKALSRLNFIGFSSYGEQYNGIHFNQTLAGVVVGKKRHD